MPITNPREPRDKSKNHTATLTKTSKMPVIAPFVFKGKADVPGQIGVKTHKSMARAQALAALTSNLNF
jgi:hypothetical protein